MPSPRKLLIEERFALSNDDLKTKSSPAARARCAHSRAIINACSRDSITHGPAIIAKRPSPKVAEPTWNDLWFINRLSNPVLVYFEQACESNAAGGSVAGQVERCHGRP